MTREEAIYILKCLNPNGDMYSADSDEEIEEALMMAIQALKQEPCEDCIDRQRAIRLVKAKCNPYGKPTIDFESGKEVIKILKQMSPAKHETKSDVLDKIRDEIEEYKSRQLAFAMDIDIADLEKGKQVALDYVLAIFDKYKAENKIEQGLDNADQDALMSAT